MEPLFERLPYSLKWTQFPIQQTQGTDCFVPFVNLAEDENIITLKLTATEVTKMLSALHNGAEMTYPEESMQIMVNFLKGIHCPPELTEDADCVAYLPSASFLTYEPANPYNAPDEIPDGYTTPPFHVNSDFAYPELFGFLSTDVMVSPDAFPIFGGWDDLLTLNFPTIKINVRGTGQIEFDFLAVQLGGYAILKVGSAPNIIDLIDGIIETGVKIIDLNQDATSLPPESDMVVQDELNIDEPDGTDVYIVFVPKIDDSLGFYGMGGGLRGFQLCGLEADVEGTIVEDVRYNVETGGLDKRVGGVWTEFASCEDLVACAPAGGGGGGSAALAARTLQITVPSGSDFTTIAPSWGNVGSINFNHTPQHTKMLMIIDNHVLLNSGAANDTDVRWTVGGNAGEQGTRARVHGTNGREVQWSDWFQGLTVGAAVTCQLQGRVSAGTGTINQNAELNVTIIEFDNLTDLFVQDIRIVSRELQKKIGGVWITVSDSLATILNSIETIANNALALATSATSTNVTQASQITSISAVNTAQNTRLTNLESDVDDLQLSVAQHNLDIAGLDTRLDAVEALQNVLAFGGAWAWLHDFTINAAYTATSGTWVSGQGWVSSSGLVQMVYLTQKIYWNQISHIQWEIYCNSASGLLEISLDYGTSWIEVEKPAAGVLIKTWARVPNSVGDQFLDVRVRTTVGELRIEKMRYLGRGDDIPFD